MNFVLLVSGEALFSFLLFLVPIAVLAGVVAWQLWLRPLLLFPRRLEQLAAEPFTVTEYTVRPRQGRPVARLDNGNLRVAVYAATAVGLWTGSEMVLDMRSGRYQLRAGFRANMLIYLDFRDMEEHITPPQVSRDDMQHIARVYLAVRQALEKHVLGSGGAVIA